MLCIFQSRFLFSLQAENETFGVKINCSYLYVIDDSDAIDVTAQQCNYCGIFILFSPFLTLHWHDIIEICCMLRHGKSALYPLVRTINNPASTIA